MEYDVQREPEKRTDQLVIHAIIDPEQIANKVSFNDISLSQNANPESCSISDKEDMLKGEPIHISMDVADFTVLDNSQQSDHEVGAMIPLESSLINTENGIKTEELNNIKMEQNEENTETPIEVSNNDLVEISKNIAASDMIVFNSQPSENGKIESSVVDMVNGTTKKSEKKKKKQLLQKDGNDLISKPKKIKETKKINTEAVTSKIKQKKGPKISKTVSTVIDPNKNDNTAISAESLNDETSVITPTVKRVKTSVINLRCMICDKYLSSEKNLMKHLLTHNNNHTCRICMRTFKSTHFLKHHMDKHNESYQYSCPICNKKFKFKNNMRGHLRKHNMEKKFQCHICEKKFIGKYNLKEHMKSHCSDRPFECNFCKKAYKDKGSLNKHLLSHQEKKVECDICHRQFTSHKQVARHMQFHYSWPGDTFKRKSNLGPNGEKMKFTCQYCDKTFNHYSNMNAHIHKKHKEKKVQCPECPKTFAYQYELREHMFIHSNGQDSKFKCSVCDKTFQRSTTLKNHERTTHLGIKRFKCGVCGKMFGTKFNMKVHVDKLHNENNTNGEKPKPKRSRATKADRTPVSTQATVTKVDENTVLITTQLEQTEPEHQFLTPLPIALAPPHQHPLLRNMTTSDIIRNAISHIPELGYFPPLQPHPTRGYQFYGIPPADFGTP